MIKCIVKYNFKKNKHKKQIFVDPESYKVFFLAIIYDGILPSDDYKMMFFHVAHKVLLQ